MALNYIQIPLDQIIVGEPLPGTLYLNLDSRFVVYRPPGEIIDANTFDRFQFKNVTNLYIAEEDLPKFQAWGRKQAPASDGPPGAAANKEFLAAWKNSHRTTLDIFQAEHPNRHIASVMATSRKLVAEAAKIPYVVQSLEALQVFSRGTVDHSMNVSVLATYLALQMGYSSSIILQHVGLGALLHDIGKRKIDILDEDSEEAARAKLREHPTLGLRLLESMEVVPNEVKLIVVQHHELHDGSGYPKKLRNTNIYDLSRIVSIANVFDHLVADGRGTLPERQRAAVAKFDEKYFNKFDPDKHDKAVRILKQGV